MELDPVLDTELDTELDTVLDTELDSVLDSVLDTELDSVLDPEFDSVLDPEFDSVLDSVIEQLDAAGTAQNRKIYARHGAADPMFGVSAANMGRIRKPIGNDHGLALQLWATGNHDARVMGLHIADPDALTMQQAERWVSDVGDYILAEGLGGLCSRSPQARALSDMWRDQPSEWVASTGWFILTCTAENPDVWTSPELRELLRQIEAEIGSRPNRVRHEMNGALITMALRDGNIRRSVLAAARRIGPVLVDHGQTGCKTSEVEPYVERTLAHRATMAQRAADRAAAKAASKAKRKAEAGNRASATGKARVAARA